MSSAIECLELKGTRYEMGRIHGEARAKGIGTLCDDFLDEICRVAYCETTEDQLLSLSRHYMAVTEPWAPHLMEEMRGIADGAGLPLERVFCINCFLDFIDLRNGILYNRLLGPGRPKDYSPFAPEGACSAFVANGSVTSDGRTYVGQNYDMSPIYQPHTVLLKIPAQGKRPEVLAFTFEGILACTGINSAGVALNINTLFPQDTRPGVPYSFLMRVFLEQPAISAGLDLVLPANRASGTNMMMADEELALNIELTATRAAHVVNECGFLVHTNHYVSPDVKGLDLPVQPATTYIRYQRIRDLLARRAGSLNTEVLKGILSDRACAPTAVSLTTPDDYKGKFYRAKTVAGLIGVPAERTMYVANGTPSETAWQEFAL